LVLLQLLRTSAPLVLCHAPLENRLLDVHRYTDLFPASSGGADGFVGWSYAGEQW